MVVLEVAAFLVAVAALLVIKVTELILPTVALVAVVLLVVAVVQVAREQIIIVALVEEVHFLLEGLEQAVAAAMLAAAEAQVF
jgi:hypothetical protein